MNVKVTPVWKAKNRIGSVSGGNCGGKGKQNGDTIMYFALFSLLFLCAFSLLVHFLQWKTIFSPGISPYLLWGVAAFFSIPLIHFPRLPAVHTCEEIQRHFIPCAVSWVEVSPGNRTEGCAAPGGQSLSLLCSKAFQCQAPIARLAEPWASGHGPASEAIPIPLCSISIRTPSSWKGSAGMSAEGFHLGVIMGNTSTELCPEKG